MKIILLLILLLSSSCERKLDYWWISYPPEVHEQIELFKEYAPDGTKSMKLTILLTGEIWRNGVRAAGISSPTTQTIKLDTTSLMWKLSKTSLVLHELGHFVLFRVHTDGLLKEDIFGTKFSSKGFPVSLMNSYLLNPREYHWESPDMKEYYMNELFNRWRPLSH